MAANTITDVVRRLWWKLHGNRAGSTSQYPFACRIEIRPGKQNCHLRRPDYPASSGTTGFNVLVGNTEKKRTKQNETEKATCLNRDYNLIAEFLPCYKRVLPPASQDYENTVRTLKDHADFVPYFRSTRSKLHDELKKHLGLATPVEAIVLPDKLPTSH